MHRCYQSYRQFNTDRSASIVGCTASVKHRQAMRMTSLMPTRGGATRLTRGYSTHSCMCWDYTARPNVLRISPPGVILVSTVEVFNSGTAFAPYRCCRWGEGCAVMGGSHSCMHAHRAVLYRKVLVLACAYSPQLLMHPQNFHYKAAKRYVSSYQTLHLATNFLL